MDNKLIKATLNIVKDMLNNPNSKESEFAKFSEPILCAAKEQRKLIDNLIYKAKMTKIDDTTVNRIKSLLNNDLNLNPVINKLYLYPKRKIDVDTLCLHFILSSAANLTFRSETIHQELEQILNAKISYHISYDGEVGKLSTPPANAILLYSKGD